MGLDNLFGDESEAKAEEAVEVKEVEVSTEPTKQELHLEKLKELSAKATELQAGRGIGDIGLSDPYWVAARELNEHYNSGK